MFTIRAMTDGKGYSSRHLEHSDYYAEGERVVGHWQGRGAELLDLGPEVKPEEFEALRQGLDPKSGEFLRQRKSADRVSSDGTVLSHGRSLYDFTISAPKSVSIMAILGGDKRIIEAHERAVSESLRELETYASARVRRDGANENRNTGCLVLAVYHHDTSRELDPQIHTHAVAANLTYDGTEGRWKALQASEIYERRAYLTEVYRNALAREVRILGYEIENRRDAKGRDCGFELRGVSRDLLKRFSQRSRQRDEAIGEFAAKTGRLPTDNEVAVLVRQSRADKLVEISTEELRLRQRGRLTPEETGLLSELRPEVSTEVISIRSAEPSVEYGKAHVFERVSVSPDHVILSEALRHGRGQIRLQDLKGILTLQVAAGRILCNESEIATRESLDRERQMIDRINQGIGRFEPLGDIGQLLISDRLSPEQKRVVEFVLGSRDRVVNVSGAAGTGKTATLEEIQRGLLEAGHGIVAAAPTMSAVEELQKAGLRNAITLERLLKDPQAQKALAGNVLILDEAGMVSGRQMSELLEIAERESTRIVFSGDTQQIQSVESCDALRVLERESRLKTVTLTNVRRQTENRYREAIQALRKSPALGLERLDAIGALREVAWIDLSQAVAEAFDRYKSQSREPLVVCATHDEIDRVTEAIRSTRKAKGEISNGVQFSREISLNWTSAQKSDTRNLLPGQVLRFHRAVKGLAKNESAEVIAVEGARATVRTVGGKLRSISGKESSSFDVCSLQPIEVAPGDRLLITSNRREPGFRVTNGEIITVKAIDRHGRIHFGDGRVAPHDFTQFDYGYAVTAHRSQGKSVDAVIVSADGMKRELFYVAASRGRERAEIITSNKALLCKSVERSSERQSASELARKVRPGLHQGIQQGLAAARRLATWAAQHLIPDFPVRRHALHRTPEPHRIEPHRIKERSYGRGLGR